ncbi:MAG: hypothetical protein EHM61_13770 [Acidobacteria bacterium]|nr:MAG: hypothetical protein EHM61_13770 [Acidobacteriota bacterium]
MNRVVIPSILLILSKSVLDRINGINRMRSAFPVLAVLLQFSLAFGLDPGRSIRQYKLDLWSSEEILPALSIQCLAQSRDGYLWLGTPEGAVRFDGVRFTCFSGMTNEVFSPDDVTAMLPLSGGAIWLGTWGGGIFESNDGKLKSIADEKMLGDGRIKSLFQDREGRIWVGTPNGLHCLEAGRWSEPDKNWGSSRLNVGTVLQRRDGSLWFGTTQGVARLEADHLRWYGTADGLPGASVRALVEDKTGTLWIGTSNGLCRLRQGRLKSYALPGGANNQDVFSLCLDRDGNLWIGTDGGGLNRLRDEAAPGQGFEAGQQVAETIERLTTAEGLPSDSIWSILEDKEGNLWIGAFGGGIARLQESKFVTFDTGSGLPDDLVWSIYEDDEQTLYLGTDAGLTVMTAGRIRNLGAAEGLPPGGTTSLLKDSRGTLWVAGGSEGLYRMKAGKAIAELKPDGQGFEHVFSIIEDRSGTLWVGTRGGGLKYWRDNRWHVMSRADGLADDVVRTLLEDDEAGIWIGTQQAGVLYLRNGRITRYGKENGLSDNSILCLHQDSDGILWIGTDGGGLNRLEKGKITSFGIRDGLFHDTIFQILEDDAGDLWMSCNRGIFRVAKSDLAAFSSGRSKAISCHVYGRSDGIKSSECNNGGHPAGIRTRDGRIWFPTLKGAVAIDPARHTVNRIPPPVIIEDFRAGGRSVPADGRESIRPEENNVEFHFTAPSLSAPERIRFRYQLIGSDTDWLELNPGRERIAYYTNLSPGRYTFRVIACNNDGLWNDTGAALTYEVLPDWHQTTWFYGLLAVGLILSGGGLAHGARRALGSLRLTRSLTHYHSRSLVETVRTGELEQDGLRDERRILTIFFSDLTGFSDFTDRTEPERVSRLINEYLTEMASLIEVHRGTFGRFMGDGIMAFFGAPRVMPAEEQARQAVAMAVAMQQKMKGLAEKWLNEGLDHDIRIRMGIAQGTVTVGNFGSSDLMQYTAVGAGVNLASRLEKNCPPGKILVNQTVYDATRALPCYSRHRFQALELAGHNAQFWVLDPECAEG